MGIHKWRKRQTRYFGETWVPYAQIDIARSDGKYQSFALQIDSGAVISLLRRSVAELLGIELEKGERVELGNVGGGQTEAYVHRLQTRFADRISLAVPYAIAAEETVPNLLGRQGVFDNLQIDFDATLDETRIAARWMNSQQRLIWEATVAASEHIFSRWEQVDYPNVVKQATKPLLQRASQLVIGVAGLIKLGRDYAGLLFIRSLFECAAQLEYMLGEQSEMEGRAQRYLDFAHVTKHLRSQEVANNPEGPISSFIANSPMRFQGEKKNQAEYDRVRKQFIRKGNRLWPNWYCKTISGLSKEIGWEGEYRFWHKLGSAWAHADPFYSQRPNVFGATDGTATFLMSLHYFARMLLRISVGIILTPDQYELLTKLSEDIC